MRRQPENCLVLGGRGFMGSHLVDRLLRSGQRVRCFDRPRTQLLGVSHLGDPDFELFEGDFLNEADVGAALAGCNVCFHLISSTLPQTSNADPVFDVESNVSATLRMLSQAVKAGVRKIVFVSSGGTVYGLPKVLPIEETHATDPLCSYGIGKLAIEKYLALFRHLYGLEYVILRIANPFGERQRTNAQQGAVAVFLGKALRGETIEIWGDGSIVRDYIHIDDVISALLVAADYRGDECIFNIGSGHGLSLNEVLDAIERTTGRIVTRKYVPRRSFDVPANVLDIERASRLLGWKPRLTFNDGLARFKDWLLEESEEMSAGGLEGAQERAGIGTLFTLPLGGAT